MTMDCAEVFGQTKHSLSLRTTIFLRSRLLQLFPLTKRNKIPRVPGKKPTRQLLAVTKKAVLGMILSKETILHKLCGFRWGSILKDIKSRIEMSCRVLVPILFDVMSYDLTFSLKQLIILTDTDSNTYWRI